MRLGRLATDLFTLKYQTKHFLYCEVSIKQDTGKVLGQCDQIQREKDTERKRQRQQLEK